LREKFEIKIRINFITRGPFLENPGNFSGPEKPFLVNQYLIKDIELYTPETFCMKGTLFVLRIGEKKRKKKTAL